MLQFINTLFVIFLVWFCFGCNRDTGKNEKFEVYIKKFKSHDLPIKIKGCIIQESGMAEVTAEADSPFIVYPRLIYGTFKTNGNYFATITLGEADCYLPTLTTFDKNGNMIDEKEIAIGRCGSDCGFTCEEFMFLGADYSIYTSDTISTYQCDSLGNPVPGSQEYYVIYKKGKMLSTGKIELSEEIKKAIK